MTEKITAGIYNGMPFSRYNADPCVAPSLRSSIANIILQQTPRHAWGSHPRLNPSFAKVPSARQNLGSAAHALILGRNLQDIELIKADSFRTDAAKKQRDKAIEAGRIPLLEKEIERLREMEKVIRLEADAVPELKQFKIGKIEQTLIWSEVIEGQEIWLRARPDWLHFPDHKLIISYKTAKDAEPEKFVRTQIAQNGYDVQAAMECSFFQERYEKTPMYIWIVQEIDEPFVCSFIGYGEAMREIAEEKLAHAKRIWAKCMRENSWPAYKQQVAWASPPAFVVNQWQEYKAANGLIVSSQQL